jgi:dUTP pyrophosphatase
MEIPEGTYAQVAPRTSLAWKNGVHIGMGVINSDYRGHLKVLIVNQGTQKFDIQPNDHIAQLIFELNDPTPVEEVQEHEETICGE